MPSSCSFDLMVASQRRKCRRVPFFDRSKGSAPLVAAEAPETSETVLVLRRESCSGGGKFLLQPRIAVQVRARHPTASWRSIFQRICGFDPCSLRSARVRSRRAIARRRPDKAAAQEAAVEPALIRHFDSAGTGGGAGPGPAIVEIVPIVERDALPPRPA